MSTGAVGHVCIFNSCTRASISIISPFLSTMLLFIVVFLVRFSYHRIAF